MKKIILAITFVIVSYSLIATTWSVFPNGSIQTAVNNASSGDTILVYDGVYEEYIEIPIGKSDLIFESVNGPDDCIISAPYFYGTCLYAHSHVDRFEGFTVTGASWGDTAIDFHGGVNIITNCIFEDNNLTSGNVLESWSTDEHVEEISYCIFRNNSAQCAIYLNEDYSLNNDPVAEGNYINNLIEDGMFYIINASSGYHGNFVNNTFDDTSNGLYLYLADEVSIKNCIFSSTGITIGPYGSDVTVSYSCFTNSGYQNDPYFTWGSGNLVSTNPQFVNASNDDYELEWNDTVKSPCIDTGDPNSSLDPDGTRADMGVYYCDHDEITYSFTVPQGHQTGIKWLSFEILDPTDAATYNQVQYFLTDIFPNFYNGEHEVTEFSYNYLTQQWTHGDVLVTSPKGFKIRVTDDDDFDVSGFRCEANTTFDIEAEEDWIGYFLEDTQHVYDAFDGYLDDIASITHQDWSVRQSREEWPDVGYTLSSGDMVIVELRSDIDNFSWPVPERTEPFIVLEPRLYSYTEEMDYIPIYIDLDENNLPDEIGVFLDDECVGARVVQHDFENVCTYATEAQSGEIEIEFAYYERGSRQRFKEYTVYDEETGYRETTTINLEDNKQDYYYISFNSKPGNNNTPQSNELTISNSPNPFNPSTSIYYNLPIEDHVQLSIYNLKGQKVKVLAEDTQPAGNYNVIWDGTDSTGKSVSSGVYFYQISTSSQTIKKKMLLLK